MTTHSTAVDHPTRRLAVALPRSYDAAREHYETLVPEVDFARFFQMASWQATLELAEINAPHGFMRYYRSDITAANGRIAILLESHAIPEWGTTPSWNAPEQRRCIVLHSANRSVIALTVEIGGPDVVADSDTISDAELS